MRARSTSACPRSPRAHAPSERSNAPTASTHPASTHPPTHPRSALLEGARDRDTLVVLYAPWCPHCQAMEASYAELATQLAGSSVRVAKFQVGAPPLLALALLATLLPSLHARLLALDHPPLTRPPTLPFPACPPACPRPPPTHPPTHPQHTHTQADVEREFSADKFGLQTFPTVVLMPKGAKQGEMQGGGGGRGGAGARRLGSAGWGRSPPSRPPPYPSHPPPLAAQVTLSSTPPSAATPRPWACG